MFICIAMETSFVIIIIINLIKREKCGVANLYCGGGGCGGVVAGGVVGQRFFIVLSVDHNTNRELT